MSSTLSHALTIDRVALSLAEATPLAQRQWQRHLHRTLGQVSVTPALPPQSILIVRHLADPHPGKLLAEQGRKTWETAAQNALNDCWRKAVRPIYQTVSTEANSVWFADSAEWLACLSLDIWRGVACDRWWWQTALKPYSSLLSPSFSPAQFNSVRPNNAQTISHLWQEHTQWLPPALNHLVRQHPAEIIALIKAFTPAQLQPVFAQIIQSYNVPSVPSVLSELPKNLPTLLQSHLPDSVRSALLSLPFEAQSFMTVALTLPHTEHLLRKATEEIGLGESNFQQLREGGEGSLRQDFAIDQESRTQAEATNPIETDSAQQPSTAKKLPSPRPTVPRIVSMQSTPLNSGPSEVAPSKTKQTSPSETKDRSTIPPSKTSSLTTETEITIPSQPSPEEGIVTTVGGLWYLVNVLVELAWPADSSSLSPWHQLLSLTQSFLPEVPTDPVWTLLAEAADEPNALSTTHHQLIRTNTPSPWQIETLPQARTYLQARSLLTSTDSPYELSKYLLEPALLYFTRTHINVVFSLEQIQLDLRLAGLDQNPGWVPELGRVITFHYE